MDERVAISPAIPPEDSRSRSHLVSELGVLAHLYDVNQQSASAASVFVRTGCHCLPTNPHLLSHSLREFARSSHESESVRSPLWSHAACTPTKRQVPTACVLQVSVGKSERLCRSRDRGSKTNLPSSSLAFRPRIVGGVHHRAHRPYRRRHENPSRERNERNGGCLQAVTFFLYVTCLPSR